jgi:squalene monooxygenase
MSKSVDVVVVGAGIAGGALAAALVRGGKSVLVLERSTEYVDHVRGEYMHPGSRRSATTRPVRRAD